MRAASLFTVLGECVQQVYLRLHVSIDQFERHIYMKIILIVIIMKLVANSYLFVRFLSVKIKNENQTFGRLVVWQRKTFRFIV